MVTYVTVQDMRDRGVPDEVGDTEILRALARATMLIDGYCGRDFWLREETYLVDGSGKAGLFLDDRPVVVIDEIKVDDCVVPAESYRVYGDVGYVRMVGERTIFMGHPGTFTLGTQNVEVRGSFGFEEVPPEVKEACAILTLAFLRLMRGELNVTESQANTTDKAVGIKRVKVDDLSVEFEYPRETTVGASRKRTTGVPDADRLLWRYRRDIEAMVV